MKTHELIQMMLDWQRVSAQALELEHKIKQEVLKLGKSVGAGDVQATYYNQSEEKDYATAAFMKAAVDDDPDRYNAIVEEHTTYKPSVSWKKVCEDLGVEEDRITVTVKPARVVLKVR